MSSVLDRFCPVCYCPRPTTPLSDGLLVDCDRCGTYAVTNSAVDQLLDESLASEAGSWRLGPMVSRRRANASGWLRFHRDDYGPDHPLTSLDIARLAAVPSPSFSRRCEMLMSKLERETEFAGQTVMLLDSGFRPGVARPWLGETWCLNEKELLEVARAMEESGWLELSLTEGKWTQMRITPKGWAHLEELRFRPTAKDQGFVAMSFDPDIRYVYDTALSPAILAAQYKPVIMSDVEHAELIDDRMVAEIRRSRFMVAEFTRQRQNVYFEAGFARGLGMPVFWVCKSIPAEAPKEERLHFDTAHFAFIMWDNPQELQVRLQRRIEHEIGRGTYVAP